MQSTSGTYTIGEKCLNSPLKIEGRLDFCTCTTKRTTQRQLCCTPLRMSIVKYIAVGTNVMLNNVTLFVIRASVDALCRDGVSEISRDQLTKRLLTR